MVAHRKDIEKQIVEVKEVFSSYERLFVQIVFLKIVSVALQKKDMKKRKLESYKICFLQKVVLT